MARTNWFHEFHKPFADLREERLHNLKYPPHSDDFKAGGLATACMVIIEDHAAGYKPVSALIEALNQYLASAPEHWAKGFAVEQVALTASRWKNEVLVKGEFVSTLNNALTAAMKEALTDDAQRRTWFVLSQLQANLLEAVDRQDKVILRDLNKVLKVACYHGDYDLKDAYVDAFHVGYKILRGVEAKFYPEGGF